MYETGGMNGREGVREGAAERGHGGQIAGEFISLVLKRDTCDMVKSQME